MSDPRKFISLNRKARHDYHILESFEAGMVLVGTEVKSLRAGKVNLKDSYASIDDGELWLHGLHISPYERASYNNHDPERSRKLLISKLDLKRLAGKVLEKGFTLVPLALYFKEGWAKVEIGLARGKRQYDKRHAIAERDADRALARARRGERE